jgi:hypothetical protein
LCDHSWRFDPDTGQTHIPSAFVFVVTSTLGASVVTFLSIPRGRINVAAGLFVATAATAVAQGPKLNRYGFPEKHTPKPTTAAITQADLMTRLYVFADDSMLGRRYRDIGNMKGTAYIARELQRIGVAPMGVRGTYFQNLDSLVQRKFTAGTLTVGATTLRFNQDFVPIPGARAPRAISNAPVVYGGVAGDTVNMISAEAAKGKFVIFAANPNAPARGGGGGRGGRGGGGGAAGGMAARLPEAAAIATADLTLETDRAALNNPAPVVAGPGQGGAGGGSAASGRAVVMVKDGHIAIYQNGTVRGTLPPGTTAADMRRYADSVTRADSIAAAGRGARGGAPGGGGAAARGGAPGGRGAGGAGAAAVVGPPPATIRLTKDAAELLLGKPLAGLTPGAAGKVVSGRLTFTEANVSSWARNVIGIVRGSDPVLRNQYIVISAHNDHEGKGGPADHDSLKMYRDLQMAAQFIGADTLRAAPADVQARIRASINLDSLRRIRPARIDTVFNGADDDGSGSMAVLEIAEYVAKMPVKPKRSIVFAWQTGEESGLLGSAYYAANPTVPLDSIVANINMDMIGRGRPEDIPGGGPDYLGVVGSKRLSGDLGSMVVEANKRQPNPFRLDYRYDQDVTRTLGGAYNNIYGRSDHANYARRCIPIAFFFTGLHADYHQLTDEPQYIDYPHYTAITNFLRDLVVDVGNAAKRPALDTTCMRP